VQLQFEYFKFSINEVRFYSLFKISSVSCKRSHLILSNDILFYGSVFGNFYVFIVVLSMSLWYLTPFLSI
jgi:hypothetical protein